MKNILLKRSTPTPSRPETTESQMNVQSQRSKMLEMINGYQRANTPRHQPGLNKDKQFFPHLEREMMDRPNGIVWRTAI